jgi:ubiquinone/menaquinone biosynthesis C-methylase UbiE
MVNLLHIVNDPGSILQESSRVLRDGGKVVVADITSQGTPPPAGTRLGLRYLKVSGEASRVRHSEVSRNGGSPRTSTLLPDAAAAAP